MATFIDYVEMIALGLLTNAIYDYLKYIVLRIFPDNKNDRPAKTGQNLD